MEISTENILFKKMADYNDNNIKMTITKIDYHP